MKKNIILPILVFFVILMSCDKEFVKAPKNLIEQDKMVDIMYDLALLSAIKVQYSSYSNVSVINSNEYIYKKHKIDSIQYVQSNIYYASNIKEYKKMIEQIKSRLVKTKSTADFLNKTKAKKDSIRLSIKDKIKLKKAKDSVANANRELKKRNLEQKVL